MADTQAQQTEHPAEAIAEEHPLVDTPKQLLVLVFLSFAVPVTILIMLAVLVTGAAFEPGQGEMTEQAIAARIKPVGQVTIAEGPSTVANPAAAAATPAAGAPAPAVPTVPPPAAVAAAPAAAAPAAAAGADGKAIYEKVCSVCHAAGVAGAPKFDDKAAWAPRIAQGLDALVQAALKGKGAMPPKGGNPQLTDAEVRAAVQHMVGAVK